MTLHRLRTRIHERPLIGTTIAIPSPVVVEALGSTAFDLICIDAEHTPLSVEGLEGMLRAADLAPQPALVRVPEVGSYIARSLDMGAAGIVVPRVETAAQAAEAVERARYVPEGRRGVGPGRATGYGATLADHVARANDEILVAIQVETKDGVDAVEAILAVPGVDAVVIGPFDLAISLGVDPGSPRHTEAIRAVFAAAAARGIATGAFVFDVGEVAGYLDAGADLILYGADLISVVDGASTACDRILPLLHRSEGGDQR